MKIQFTKMHGLGNDFVVIDAINQNIDLSPEQIRYLADRHRGIGCDQLLLVEPAKSPQVEFTYRIFNADGGEVEQCGNGARCFARFVHDKGLSHANPISVATNAGNISLSLQEDGQVTVNMGVPIFTPAQIPFVAEREATHYPLQIDRQTLEVGVVSMGNPHAVLQVDDIQTAPVTLLGPRIESHPRFPNRVNAGFIQVIDRTTIQVRVFERGVGETQACGTGACAAMVIGRHWNLLDENVQVLLTGGTLNIKWKGVGEPVYMTGPTQTVFEGTIEL
jgi:diaminopimelate epimerase